MVNVTKRLIFVIILCVSNMTFAHGGNEFVAKLGGGYYLYDTCGGCYSIGFPKDYILVDNVNHMRCLESVILGQNTEGEFFAIDKKTAQVRYVSNLKDLGEDLAIGNFAEIKLLKPNPYIRHNIVYFKTYLIVTMVLALLLRISFKKPIKPTCFSLRIAGMFSALYFLIGFYFYEIGTLSIIRTAAMFCFLLMISYVLSFIANKIR